MAVGTSSGELQVWDVKSKTKTFSLNVNGEVTSVRYNLGLRNVACSTVNGRINIITLSSGQMTCSLASSQWPIRKIEFSPHQR
jgi:WD40 repeat protein